MTSAPELRQEAGQHLHQQQILAPHLRQALEILQAPLPELRALIRRELEVNPVLEEKPDRDESLDAAPGEATAEGPDREEIEFREDYDLLTRLDDEWREFFAQNEPLTDVETAEERRRFLFDSLTRSEVSLQEYLTGQLGYLDLSPEDRNLALLLIGSLNEDGYLNVTLGELWETTGHAVDRLERVLSRIQELDPPGVGARDLRECLLLQLRRAGRENGLEAALVRDHLEALAEHRHEELARVLNVPVEEVRRAAAVIGTLEPKPGRNFCSEPAHPIVPEIEIVREGDRFVARLKRDHLPRIRISRQYRQMFEDPRTPPDARDYLRDRIRAAMMLIRGVDHRNQTVLRIANEIARRQHRFFEEGPDALVPMTMSEIAKEVGVHETTVSRAVHGKFAETPRGVFELREFFTHGYQAADGQAVSSEAVKRKIARWIAEEDPAAPLSDQEIADRLAAEGLPVARRTVAKYREEMNIPPSHERRS